MPTREGSVLRGSAIEQAAKPPHGPQVAHSRRRLRQAEHFGRLGRREVLEVPQEHDLAIALVEQLHGGGESPLELVPCRRGGRRQLAVGDGDEAVGRGALPILRGLSFRGTLSPLW